MPIWLCAQTPDSMRVHQTDATLHSSALVTIQQITFEGNTLVLATSEGTFRLPLQDVGKITFGSCDASIGSSSPDIHLSQSGNQLTIKCDLALHHVYLVDMSGRVLVNQTLESVNTATITLPNHGVFVLLVQTNQGYLARKVIVRDLG